MNPLLGLAQTTPESLLLERGVLGLAVLVLGLGFLFLAKRLVKERDELAAQRESMIETLLTVVPLVSRTTEVLEQHKFFVEQSKEIKAEMLSLLKEMRTLQERK